MKTGIAPDRQGVLDEARDFVAAATSATALGAIGFPGAARAAMPTMTTVAKKVDVLGLIPLDVDVLAPVVQRARATTASP